MRLAPALAVAGLILSTAASGHPGALDANGCHRVRKSGARVCHAGHVKPGEPRRFVGYDGEVRHFGR